MQNHCVFYVSERPQLCELIEAITKRELDVEQRSYLERTYCQNAAYRKCPVFQKFEKCLANAELQLSYSLVA